MDNKKTVLTADDLDTIGEVMNISMGSAATAVSSMLERQVTITTPHCVQNAIEMVDCKNLEPAILVKIRYIQGIEGTNLIMLRKHDMKLILDLLMGNDIADAPDEEFEFDDMSMSAACEVMNQMMGASATALSEVLSRPVNISTPTASTSDTASNLADFCDNVEKGDEVVVIAFQLKIKDLLDTTFNCILPVPMAHAIVAMLNGEETADAPQPEAPAPAAPAVQQAPAAAAPAPTAPAPQPAPTPAPAPQSAAPMQPAPMQQPAQMPMQQMPMQQMPMQQMPLDAQGQPMYGVPQMYGYGAPGSQPMYGYPMQGGQPMQGAQPMYSGQPMQTPAPQNNIAIQQPEFPSFVGQGSNAQIPYNNNLQMLMSVQLEVSVIIGRTKRSIKDILDFGQGTVLELDKQTGAPAEIVVNGQLLAYGDVVVVGDNFGVRVTEIVGTKDLLNSVINETSK